MVLVSCLFQKAVRTSLVRSGDWISLNETHLEPLEMFRASLSMTDFNQRPAMLANQRWTAPRAWMLVLCSCLLLESGGTPLVIFWGCNCLNESHLEPRSHFAGHFTGEGNYSFTLTLTLREQSCFVTMCA